MMAKILARIQPSTLALFFFLLLLLLALGCKTLDCNCPD
jgi:hypothetical protein